MAVDWPYAPLQPIAADITFTNDQGPPGAAPLTTPPPANPFGLTSAPPTLCSHALRGHAPSLSGGARSLLQSLTPFPTTAPRLHQHLESGRWLSARRIS